MVNFIAGLCKMAASSRDLVNVHSRDNYISRIRNDLSPADLAVLGGGTVAPTQQKRQVLWLAQTQDLDPGIVLARLSH